MNKPKISIIIPVYNGENYIKKTINSVLKQTFKDFELILIDDSSTDNSYEILTNFASKDKRIKFYQKENGGNAVKSIIFALPHIICDYMFYCSQDDLMSEDLLEKMYLKAIETDATCVIPNMLLYYEKKEAYYTIIKNKKINEELSGYDAFILSLNWNIHGFSLRKTELVKKLGFIDDTTFSDEYLTRLFFLESNKIVFSEGTFFYRQDNNNAITKKLSVQSFEIIHIQCKLIDLIIQKKIPKKVLKKFIYDTYKLIIKKKHQYNKNISQFNEQDSKKIKSEISVGYAKINEIINKNRFYLLKITISIKKILYFIKFSDFIPNYFKINNIVFQRENN